MPLRRGEGPTPETLSLAPEAFCLSEDTIEKRFNKL
jgi:hypothetical protein